MGTFNPSTPTMIGSEWSPNGQVPVYVLDSPTKAVAMRFQGTVNTVTALHVFLQSVVGNPGLAVEIVDTLSPVPPAGSPQIAYPGSDTSSVQAGWENVATTTLLAAQLVAASRFGLANYGQNIAAAVGPALPMSFRGGASLPGSSRVLSVMEGLTAWLTIAGYPNFSPYVALTSDLTIAGTRYKSAGIPLVASIYGASDLLVTNWPINPATNLPFTMADVNAIINGTDSFGMGLAAGTLVALALRVASIYLQIAYCVENRHGQSYVLSTAPHTGWNKATLAATVALLANTWYWVVISCPNATPTAYATVPVFGYQSGLPAPATGAGTGEHRQYGTGTLTGLAGAVKQTAAGATPPTVAGQALGVLLDAGGTILPESQPYVASPLWTINTAPHDNSSPQLALVSPGQQITTPGGGPFSIAGIQAYVSFEGGPQVIPDRPLVFSIKTGATGGGSVVGTCTLDPAKVIGGVFFGTVPADGGAAISLATSTQYSVVLTSAASVGKGWVIPIGDTRSDLAVIGGSTVNAVEQASIGPGAGTGQTDGVINNAAALTRYDMGLALIQGPTAPASVTATVSGSVQ